MAEGIDAPSLADADGNGVPNFVEQVLRIAEHVHDVENDKLGWREPKSDGRKGGGSGKTDIYLSQIGGELFGYAAPDRGQASKEHRIPRRLHGYLVLDNDYSAFEFPGTKPLEDLAGDPRPRVQPHPPVRLRRLPGPLVRRVDRDLDGGPGLQRHRRLPALRAALGQALGHAADRPARSRSTARPSGTSGWSAATATAIVRKAWARAIHVRPGGFSVGAYERAIRAAGPSDLGHDFARFAAAVAEWRTGEGFRESGLYPGHAAPGRAAAGRQPLTRLLNHTTFQLLRVHARRRPRGGRRT